MSRLLLPSERQVPLLIMMMVMIVGSPHFRNSVVVSATGTPASAYGPRVENIPEDRFSWTAELTRGFGTSTSWGCGVVDDNDLTKLYAARDTGTQIVRFDNEVEAATYGTNSAGLSSTETSGPLAVCDRIINNQLYFFQKGIANPSNYIFRRLNLDDDKFYTVAGSDTAVSGDDGTGPAASFGKPHSCTFNHDGTIVWVTDETYHIIRKIVIDPASPFSTDSGVVTTVLGTKGTMGFNTGTYSATDATPMQNPLKSGLDFKMEKPKGLRYYRNEAGHEFLFVGADGFCGVERCSITDGYVCRAWNGRDSCTGNQRSPWSPEHEVMPTDSSAMRTYFPRSFLVLNENRVLTAEINALQGYEYVPGDGTYRIGPRWEPETNDKIEVGPLLGTGSFSMRLGRTGYARVGIPQCIARIGNTNAGYFLPDNNKPHHFTFGQSRTMTESVPAVPTPVPETPVPETPVPETPVPETPVPETPVPETPVPETPVPETPVPTNPTTPTPSLTPRPTTQAPATASTPQPSDPATPAPETTTVRTSSASPQDQPATPQPSTSRNEATTASPQSNPQTSPAPTTTTRPASTFSPSAVVGGADLAAAQQDRNDQETQTGGLTSAEEAGIGVSAALFVLLIIGVVTLVWCCKKKKGDEKKPHDRDPFATSGRKIDVPPTPLEGSRRDQPVVEMEGMWASQNRAEPFAASGSLRQRRSFNEESMELSNSQRNQLSMKDEGSS